MVIDSSALVAILLHEPESLTFVRLIAADSRRLVSSVNLLETAMIMRSRKGSVGARELDSLVHRSDVHAVPFDTDHVAIAERAFDRYGKGRHPAGLNLGDCAAYALHRISGEPLLCKGNDFGRTDAVLVSTSV